MSHGPIVILTALDLEYQAVRKRLTDLRSHPHPQGTRFEVGRIADGDCRIALALVGKGNQPAAVLAERAITEFHPIAVFFVGVAGARQPHIALGDVVVATHVYAYHGGTSEDDGFRSRPRVWEISHGAEQIARHIARTESWAHRVAATGRAPTVHFGPIAAGEVVLNSTASTYARRLQDRYNDALAIEMEGAGVAQAAQLNRSLPMVVVRGISDRADGTKEATDRQDWQRRAMANAAAFAMVLAGHLAAEERHRDRRGAAGADGSGVLRDTTRNIAKGNARVGVQAGVVHGDIWITREPNPPADPAEAIADLRSRIRAALAAGRLDEDTCAAAEAELAAADAALRTDTTPSRSRLVIALKKVHGLLVDVADLASAVLGVIALVQGR